MSTFKLRTTAPSTSNNYYRSTSYGGLNKALHISGGSCLPNCVGYVWGAFREMFGSCNLSTGNAKTLYGNTRDGYSRGKTPKLGAVACWGGGTYGHVAIVVGIHSDHITVAQSNYGGVRWEMVNCYKMSNGLYKSHGGNTNMQGFIYPPSGWTYEGSSSSSSTSTKDGTIKTGFNKAYAKGKTMVAKVNLNLRTQPSTNTGSVIKVEKAGTKLYYYGYYAYNGNIVWYKVSDGTNEGYVYGGVLNSGVAPYLKNANP